MSLPRASLCVLLCIATVSAWGDLQLPSNTTVEATSAAGAVVQYTASGAVGSGDDENGRPVSNGNLQCAPASGSEFPLGITTVQCKATSGNGSFEVNVVDTRGPALTLPDHVTVPATGASTVVTWSASAEDVVDGSRPVTCSPASGSSFAAGTTNVQCTSSDTRQNSSSGSFTVTVTAAPPPPPATLPDDLTREATGPDGAVVTYTASGGDGGDDENGRPTQNAHCSPASGSTFPLGTTVVQCTGGSFQVKVVDTRGPALSLPRDFSVPGSASGTAVTWNASAFDVVDGESAITCSPASGSTFPTGTTSVQCTSTDTRQNSSNGSFSVTVLEQPAPPPTLPDITREATGPDGAAVAYSVAGGADDQNGRPTQNGNCSPASGSTFPLGTTTVQCTVGTFEVTIVDTTAPALMLPGHIVTHDPVVHYVASAHDIVDGSVGVTCVPPSGSTFATGTTTVHCTASDSRNHSSAGTFLVTVEEAPDTEAPTIVSITATPDVLHPPNGKLVDVTLAVDVIDGRDQSPLVSVFDVTANETITGADWNIDGPLAVELRAERDPQGTGRIYTVWVEAFDDAGNRSVGSVNVAVPHDSGGSQTAQPATTPKRRRAVRP